jgi:hypothetical protein
MWDDTKIIFNDVQYYKLLENYHYSSVVLGAYSSKKYINMLLKSLEYAL